MKQPYDRHQCHAMPRDFSKLFRACFIGLPLEIYLFSGIGYRLSSYYLTSLITATEK